MDWRIKGAIQKVLGYVPGGAHVHSLLQQRFGGLARFDAECDLRVEDWTLMMSHLATTDDHVVGATLLEMGTGWYPALPLCLTLAGTTRIYTLDLARHLKPEYVLALVDRLARVHVATIAAAARRDPGDVACRLAEIRNTLSSGATIDASTGGVIEYRAPADAARTGLPESSVDIVFSNNVLEHLAPDTLAPCFREAYRMLRPGGIVYHSVNCGDHFAHIDPRIDQLNYLKYSDETWQWWNNAFLYQNRLRAVDFIDAARAAGFTIELDVSVVYPERLQSLDAMRVDARFSRYTREQLAITSIDFIGRKPRAT